jgi:XTP/dITP diphosphohydrolase
MPGVLSARWAGRHGDDRANLELVLGQLADVPEERRGAAFVCAAALVVPGGEEIVVHGEWAGRLTREPRGSNGFGYDPIFVPDGDTRTSAELAPEEKDALSHRGRAMRALLPHLRALTGC